MHFDRAIVVWKDPEVTLEAIQIPIDARLPLGEILLLVAKVVQFLIALRVPWPHAVRCLWADHGGADFVNRMGEGVGTLGQVEDHFDCVCVCCVHWFAFLLVGLDQSRPRAFPLAGGGGSGVQDGFVDLVVEILKIPVLVYAVPCLDVFAVGIDTDRDFVQAVDGFDEFV